MLKGSAGQTLARYHINPESELFQRPFEWPHLNFCLDRAANNICMDNYFAYVANLNVHCDWDVEHDSKNSGNQALKDAGLWKFHVTMVAAHNCTYGSQMSPARSKQIREAFAEYTEFVNPRTDPSFQYWLPFLIQHLGLEGKIDPGSSTCAEDLLSKSPQCV